MSSCVRKKKKREKPSDERRRQKREAKQQEEYDEILKVKEKVKEKEVKEILKYVNEFEVEQKMDCPYCMEKYDLEIHESRILYCGHQICSNCIMEVFVDKGKPIICYDCEQKSYLYTTCNMVVFTKLSEEINPYYINNIICCNIDIKHEATQYSINSKEFICDDCCLDEHDIIDIEKYYKLCVIKLINYIDLESLVKLENIMEKCKENIKIYKDCKEKETIKIKDERKRKIENLLDTPFKSEYKVEINSRQAVLLKLLDYIIENKIKLINDYRYLLLNLIECIKTLYKLISDTITNCSKEDLICFTDCTFEYIMINIHDKIDNLICRYNDYNVIIKCVEQTLFTLPLDDIKYMINTDQESLFYEMPN